MKLKLLLLTLFCMHISDASAVILLCGGGDCHGRYTEGQYSVIVSYKKGIWVNSEKSGENIETILKIYNPNPQLRLDFSPEESIQYEKALKTPQQCTWERTYQTHKTQFLYDCDVLKVLDHIKATGQTVLKPNSK